MLGKPIKEKLFNFLDKNPLPEDVNRREWALENAAKFGTNPDCLRKYEYLYRKSKSKLNEIQTDKDYSEFEWTDWTNFAKQGQKLKAKSKASQNHAKWSIKSDAPIYVMAFGDQQIGSWGTDYEAFERITQEIIDTPNLFVFLMGDMLQMAVKMRSVIEVMDNIIPPKYQYLILEQWLDLIKHKVIAAVWCNHATMREENVLGWSPTAKLLSDRVIYHNHIGHIDIHVNEVEYKFALSHFFQGRSMLNPTHAPMRYLRMQAHDRDIAVQGDFHVPGIQRYTEGGSDKLAVVNGSLQTSSGYAQRFFSLKTFDYMPVIRLHHSKKQFTPFMTLEEAML